MKKLNILFSVLFASLILFASCSSDDGGDNMTTDMEMDDPVAPTQNIVEIATAEGFTSLAAALTRAGLVDDLEADGTFTVFAPTNAAFDALLSTIGQTSVDDVPVAVLTDILLYHVLGDTVFSSAITPGTATTLEGSTVTLATAGGVTVNGANVTTADVEATNGVIHIIDAVLVPSDIAQFVNTVLEPAYFSNDFTTLIEAAVKAEVVDDILDAEALTIFAPTNAVFTSSGVVVADTDAETLASVLGYHVVGSKVLAADIPAVAETLQGDDIYFSTRGTDVFINNTTEITVTNIESGTGVVHLVDEVLMPSENDIVETVQALADDSNESPEFTVLLAALTRTADSEDSEVADLVAALGGDGPFTVFAPTDAAFTQLLSDASLESLDQLSDSEVEEILKYHVFVGAAFSGDLAGAIDDNNELEMLNEDNITFDLDNLEIDSGYDGASEGLVSDQLDIKVKNGVIHVIDGVLYPFPVILEARN